MDSLDRGFTSAPHASDEKGRKIQELMFPAEAASVDMAARRTETRCGEGKMVWRSWGAGPTIVLLHGGHGSWTHWLRNIPELSGHYTVLAPDMPGFGESAMPPQPYSAQSLAEIVADGLDQLVMGDAAIVGFSFGGVIGGHVARLRPNTVRRLVLVGSGGLALPRPPMKELRQWRHLESDVELQAAHQENLGILMIHDPRRIDSLSVRLQEQNTRRARIGSRSISKTDTLRKCLRDVPAALAGIWGQEDATARGSILLRGELLREFDSQAEFLMIEGAGHWVQYEAPRNFNEALISILENRRERH